MVTNRSPRIALIFPGQGSQKVGMGRAICDAYPQARAVFERADRALESSLSRTCFEGPSESLRLTATTQPAILTTSLALLEALKSRLPEDWIGGVLAAAGHSLGEYSALVAAGALELDHAVRVVRRRGEYMQEAVPDGVGAMAAVMGASPEAVEALCRDAAEGEVLAPANLNAPDQTVVAGAASAVRRLAPLAKARGIRRVIPLEVSAPFHCTLMAPARERLAVDLRRITFRDAAIPVVTNINAQSERLGERLREALVQQVTAPVRWADTVLQLQRMGAEALIEVGPGRVLSGLAKKIAPELRLLQIEDPSSLEKTLEALSTSPPTGDLT